MIIKKWACLLCISLFTVACAGEKQAFAPAISARIIEPGYRLLATKTSVLAKTSVAACDDAIINEQELKKLRLEWLVAMSAWEQAQIFRFGPIETDNIRSQYQFWPDVNDDTGKTIKQLLAREQVLTAADIEDAGAAAQGLSGLEYVLFDKENTLLLFNTAGIAAKQRCFYIKHITHKLADTSAVMVKEWSPEGKYRQMFNSAGANNPELPSKSVAISLVLDSLVTELEKIKTDKIAAALGGQTEKQQPNVYVTEAWRSQESLALIRSGIFVLSDLLDAPETGLLSMLTADTSQKALAEKIHRQLQGVHMALERIDISFNESLKSENGIAALTHLLEAVDALLQTCKNELPKALGIYLTNNNTLKG